jgi:hypothetical protein
LQRVIGTWSGNDPQAALQEYINGRLPDTHDLVAELKVVRLGGLDAVEDAGEVGVDIVLIS